MRFHKALNVSAWYSNHKDRCTYPSFKSDDNKQSIVFFPASQNIWSETCRVHGAVLGEGSSYCLPCYLTRQTSLTLSVLNQNDYKSNVKISTLLFPLWHCSVRPIQPVSSFLGQIEFELTFYDVIWGTRCAQIGIRMSSLGLLNLMLRDGSWITNVIYAAFTINICSPIIKVYRVTDDDTHKCQSHFDNYLD